MATRAAPADDSNVGGFMKAGLVICAVAVLGVPASIGLRAQEPSPRAATQPARAAEGGTTEARALLDRYCGGLELASTIENQIADSKVCKDCVQGHPEEAHRRVMRDAKLERDEALIRELKRAE